MCCSFWIFSQRKQSIGIWVCVYEAHAWHQEWVMKDGTLALFMMESKRLRADPFVILSLKAEDSPRVGHGRAPSLQILRPVSGKLHHMPDTLGFASWPSLKLGPPDPFWAQSLFFYSYINKLLKPQVLSLSHLSSLPRSFSAQIVFLLGNERQVWQSLAQIISTLTPLWPRLSGLTYRCHSFVSQEEVMPTQRELIINLT